jgi:hypothetical protein
MRKLTTLVIAIFAVSAAPAAAKLGPNPSNRALASELVRILHVKDYKALKAFLSPAFLIQRADGSWLTKEQYLEKPAIIESYKVTDVHGTRTGDVRVVRFTLQTDQTIDGQQYAQDPVPRLSTFIKVGKTWQIVSHANFNAPAKS